MWSRLWVGKGVEGEIGNTPQLDRTGEKKKTGGIPSTGAREVAPWRVCGLEAEER